MQIKTLPTIEESLKTNNGRHIGIRQIELADLLQRRRVVTELDKARAILEGAAQPGVSAAMSTMTVEHHTSGHGDWDD